jgi:hypothetical protein
MHVQIYGAGPISDPPHHSTFNKGGGGGPSWWFLNVGPPLLWRLLMNLDPSRHLPLTSLPPLQEDHLPLPLTTPYSRYHLSPTPSLSSAYHISRSPSSFRCSTLVLHSPLRHIPLHFCLPSLAMCSPLVLHLTSI